MRSGLGPILRLSISRMTIPWAFWAQKWPALAKTGLFGRFLQIGRFSAKCRKSADFGGLTSLQKIGRFFQSIDQKEPFFGALVDRRHKVDLEPTITFVRRAGLAENVVIFRLLVILAVPWAFFVFFSLFHFFEKVIFLIFSKNFENFPVEPSQPRVGNFFCAVF